MKTFGNKYTLGGNKVASSAGITTGTSLTVREIFGFRLVLVFGLAYVSNATKVFIQKFESAFCKLKGISSQFCIDLSSRLHIFTNFNELFPVMIIIFLSYEF